MMNYFKDCKTQDEAKALFRKLAKQFHPDHVGSNEKMVELQRQYDLFNESSEKNKYNFKQNVYQSSRGYGPFDSPFDGIDALYKRALKDEIRKLEAEINRLQYIINSSFEVESQNNSKIRMLEEKNYHLNMKYNGLHSDYELLKIENEKLINAYPKTIWEYFFG